MGNAVLAGHVDLRVVGPAVFWRLRDVVPGDIVVVVTEDDGERRFRVIDVVSYRAADVPIERVFGPASSPRLNLITCDGTFNSSLREYDHRLVVYTEAEE